MGKTKLWAICIMFLITFITTFALVLYKIGMALFPEIKGIMIVCGGLGLYVLCSGLMIIAFKGGELSILYPIIALNYVWVSIASPIFFETDSMNILKWIGVAFIVLGISALGMGWGGDRCK